MFKIRTFITGYKMVYRTIEKAQRKMGVGVPGGGCREQGAGRQSRRPRAARESGSLSLMLVSLTGRSQLAHPRP